MNTQRFSRAMDTGTLLWSETEKTISSLASGPLQTSSSKELKVHIQKSQQLVLQDPSISRSGICEGDRLKWRQLWKKSSCNLEHNPVFYYKGIIQETRFHGSQRDIFITTCVFFPSLGFNNVQEKIAAWSRLQSGIKCSHIWGSDESVWYKSKYQHQAQYGSVQSCRWMEALCLGQWSPHSKGQKSQPCPSFFSFHLKGQNLWTELRPEMPWVRRNKSRLPIN